MGGEVLTYFPWEKPPKKTTTFRELFEEQFPLYLAYGMTYEQYWDGPAELVKYYRKLHALRAAQRNQELWVQGRYVYDAICAAAPILNPLSKETTPREYIKEPYPLTAKEAAARRKREEEEAAQRMKDYMLQKMAAINNARQEARDDG